MPKLSIEDARDRAMAAYRRSGGTEQPANGGDVETMDGVDYIVLRNVTGILKVYRLTDDGRIEGLSEPPPGLSC